jgi:hypothetical protein
MTTADDYRKLAAQLRARARKKESRRIRVELESLAGCYVLLAERAKNRRTESGAEPASGFRPGPGSEPA